MANAKGIENIISVTPVQPLQEIVAKITERSRTAFMTVTLLPEELASMAQEAGIDIAEINRTLGVALQPQARELLNLVDWSIKHGSQVGSDIITIGQNTVEGHFNRRLNSVQIITNVGNGEGKLFGTMYPREDSNLRVRLQRDFDMTGQYRSGIATWNVIDGVINNQSSGKVKFEQQITQNARYEPRKVQLQAREDNTSIKKGGVRSLTYKGEVEHHDAPLRMVQAEVLLQSGDRVSLTRESFIDPLKMEVAMAGSHLATAKGIWVAVQGSPIIDSAGVIVLDESGRVVQQPSIGARISANEPAYLIVDILRVNNRRSEVSAINFPTIQAQVKLYDDEQARAIGIGTKDHSQDVHRTLEAYYSALSAALTIKGGK